MHVLLLLLFCLFSNHHLSWVFFWNHCPKNVGFQAKSYPHSLDLVENSVENSVFPAMARNQSVQHVYFLHVSGSHKKDGEWCALNRIWGSVDCIG